ncbi:MAG: hypothetical protein QS721_13280 [Candidatus Endonucleobacter sp. (ex Gigantidas childressi)]|nr:hypothetical protein [Candidatus Endonucleobacter sp. (ex Gigantidas childressi)]
MKCCMLIRYIYLLFIVVFFHSAGVLAATDTGIAGCVDVGVDDTIVYLPSNVDPTYEKDIIARALKKGVFQQTKISNDKMLPLKVMGHIVWVSIISFGMGMNLLVIHLEGGGCSNILTSDSAYKKIGAVIGGAPLAASAVKDLFFHMKGMITGKRQTFMSFLPCCKGDEGNDVTLDVESLNRDEVAVNCNKSRKATAINTLSVVLKVALAFVDVSYDAYAAGISGGCLMGRPFGFIIGLFWNGIPSFATALLGSTQFVELLVAPFKGGSPQNRRTRDLVTEFRACRPRPLVSSEESVTISMLPEKDRDEWVERVREKLLVQKVGLLEGLVARDQLESDFTVSKRNEVMKLFGVMALSLVGGFSMASIFASQTILSQVAESGFSVNGSQVTFSDPSLGFSFVNETCNAMANNITLIKQPLSDLSTFAIWSYLAYVIQGINVTFVFRKTCIDLYDMTGIVLDKEKRAIFSSQSKSYKFGKCMGLALGVSLVGLYSWNALGAVIPALQQQYLFRCVGNIMGNIPAPIFVAYGVAALSGLFLQGHNIIGNTLEGVFNAVGRACCFKSAKSANKYELEGGEDDRAGCELLSLEGVKDELEHNKDE